MIGAAVTELGAGWLALGKQLGALAAHASVRHVSVCDLAAQAVVAIHVLGEKRRCTLDDVCSDDALLQRHGGHVRKQEVT